MKTTKIWIYGLDENNEVIRKDWVYKTINPANIDHLGASWKADFGCARVFAIEESVDLRDAWFDYIKTRYSRNGLAAFAKLEFVMLLESDGKEIAKAA